MKLIWTKSTLPLSVLIRWGLKEPVSHFGIVFDNGIVFHSNLLGSHIEWYPTFLKHCDIVYRMEFPLGLIEEEAIYQDILNTYDGRGYDYKAFFYFCWRGILYRLFGTEFPSKSNWNSRDEFLCTELAQTLPDYIVEPSIKMQDLSIISPYKLYLEIEATQSKPE